MDSLSGHKRLDMAKGTEHARTHARTHAGERRVSITIWRAEKGLGRAGTREWGRGQSSGAGLEKRSRRKAGSHLVGLRSGMEI